MEASVPQPASDFYQQYESVRRDEIVGILLALFLGAFGIHHFYLRRTGLGILYICFFWTGITTFLGFIECFFMPGRVREFNAIQAAGIAAMLVFRHRDGPSVERHRERSQAAQAGMLTACGRCGQTNGRGRVSARLRGAL